MVEGANHAVVRDLEESSQLWSPLWTAFQEMLYDNPLAQVLG